MVFKKGSKKGAPDPAGVQEEGNTQMDSKPMSQSTGNEIEEQEKEEMDSVDEKQEQLQAIEDRLAEASKNVPLTGIKCPMKHRRIVSLKVNKKNMSLIVYSGSINTIISKKDWIAINKPKLKKTKISRNGVTNEPLTVLGKVDVTVEFAGNFYRLPALVGDILNDESLMGLQWLQAIKVDWNDIFAYKCPRPGTCKGDLIVNVHSEEPRNYFPVYVHLKVDNHWTQMVLNTGARYSTISEDFWKEIRSPPLSIRPSCNGSTISKNQYTNTGECTVQVTFKNKTCRLPVLVGPIKESIIGADWFEHLELNFSHFFASATIPREITAKHPPSTSSAAAASKTVY